MAKWSVNLLLINMDYLHQKSQTFQNYVVEVPKIYKCAPEGPNDFHPKINQFTKIFIFPNPLNHLTTPIGRWEVSIANVVFEENSFNFI